MFPFSTQVSQAHITRTDAPADLNGLFRFAERQNLVCARVPSHFKQDLDFADCVNSRVLAATDSQHRLFQLAILTL